MRKGQKASEEIKDKMRKNNAKFWLGKKMSEETKRKMSIAAKKHGTPWMKGLKPSQETIKKRIKSRKGYKHSDETKKKIGLANKGVLTGTHRSQEIKDKIGKASEGRIFSQETRKKLSDANKGRRWSEAEIEKMRMRMKGKYSKEKNYFWKGGISFYPYSMDWNKTLKRSIRERDHYTCKICGELQSDRAFDVHHIDYDKLNCNPDNLITLCHHCHAKTNNNREYWIKYFKK